MRPTHHRMYPMVQRTRRKCPEATLEILLRSRRVAEGSGCMAERPALRVQAPSFSWAAGSVLTKAGRGSEENVPPLSRTAEPALCSAGKSAYIVR